MTVVYFAPGLTPTLKGMSRSEAGRYAARARWEGKSPTSEAMGRGAEDVSYISGRTTMHPGFDYEGPVVPRRTLTETIRDAISSVKRKQREAATQREREFLASLTPAQIEGLGVINRRRAAARRAAR